MSDNTEHPEPAQRHSWLSTRPFTRRSRTRAHTARNVFLLVLIAAAAASGAALGAGLSGGPTRTVRATDPSPSDPAAFYAGRALAGNGETAIPLARAEQLAGQSPHGAVLDPSTNAIRFSGTRVSMVVLASPPGHDMMFRIGGLTDPTIQVRQGAQITLQFINGDSDMAHMLVVGRDLPASGNGEHAGWQAAAPGGAVAAARPLGDPTPAGQPAETITFTAPAAGQYWYYCAFPGHAAQGMRGRFTVRA